MTTDIPIPGELPEDASGFSSAYSESDLLGLREEFERNREKLESRQRRHVSGKTGFWTGTREGVVATLVAVVGAMAFGGAMGEWFTPGESGWFGQALKIAGGTLLMGSLVSLLGSLLAGRNPVFWGMGMPLLVYAAGSFCAYLAAGPLAAAFLFGAPVFCGLAILGGIMTAFVIDRGR